MLNSVKSPLHPPVPLSKINEVIEMPGLNWWQICLIVLASLLLLVALIFLLKLIFKERIKEIQSSDTFSEELSKLSGSSLPLNKFSEKLSLIFRQYLTEKFNTPTLFKTDQEINTNTLDQIDIEPKRKEDILSLLATLKETKFIPNSDTSTNSEHSPESLINRATQLVKELEIKKTQ